MLIRFRTRTRNIQLSNRRGDGRYRFQNDKESLKVLAPEVSQICLPRHRMNPKSSVCDRVGSATLATQVIMLPEAEKAKQYNQPQRHVGCLKLT
jgi:hypothetical protein